MSRQRKPTTSTKKDTLAELAQEKKLPLDWLQGDCGLSSTSKGAIAIPYFDAMGKQVFERLRNPPGTKRRFQQPKGVPLQPYGLNRLDAARKERHIYLCEGESDTWTLWHLGLPALGLPGAGAAGALSLDHIAGLTNIILLPDNDKSGTQFVENVRKQLSHLGFNGWLHRVQVPRDYKDVSEWYVTRERYGMLVDLQTAMEGATRLTLAPAPVTREKTAADEKKSQATQLVEMAERAGVKFIHTADEASYALIRFPDHTKNLRLGSPAFSSWLRQIHYHLSGKAPSGQAITDAVGVMTGMALHDCPQGAVHLRLAEQGGRLYIDLGDELWRAVEVEAAGWRVVNHPPVTFRHPRAMKSLPYPQGGRSLQGLRSFVNVASDEDWRLVVAWLLAALRPAGPYPLLVLNGPQGAAKSTTARVLRMLVDPNAAPIRSEPKDARDLMIAANGSWVLALDNLSYVEAWLSDALCRLSTGGSFTTRQLFTDGEEAIFTAQRPVILTSITDVATRGDLLERSLIVSLPPIAEDKRETEAAFWKRFDAAYPWLLGALLDALAGALRELPHVQLPRLPRMADFACWATACERSLGWPVGAFLAAYEKNQHDANEIVLDSSPFVPFLRSFAKREGQWSGTATDLLDRLNDMAGDAARPKEWPRNGKALSDRLKLLAPSLVSVGIRIDREREPGPDRRRIIHLTCQQEKPRDLASPASPASDDVEMIEENAIGSDARDASGTQAGRKVGRTNRKKTQGQDARAAQDARSRTVAGGDVSPIRDDDSELI